MSVQCVFVHRKINLSPSTHTPTVLTFAQQLTVNLITIRDKTHKQLFFFRHFSIILCFDTCYLKTLPPHPLSPFIPLSYHFLPLLPQGKEGFLQILNRYMEVHGTVYYETQRPPEVPAFVKNHGLLPQHELQQLLRKAKAGP